MLIPFNELFPKYNLQFKGVLHIGANVGEEFEMYNLLGIKKQVWIEANPDIFLKLKENISSNPDALALNYCVGDENKDTVLHISNNGSQSSSVLQLGTHRLEHPEVYYVGDIVVPMRTIEDLNLDLTNVDFLNIDVQGLELKVLKGIGEIVKQFKAIYLEVNKDFVYENCALVEDIDFYLGAYGFQRVETKWARNKNWGDGLYIKTIA